MLIEGSKAYYPHLYLEKYEWITIVCLSFWIFSFLFKLLLLLFVEKRLLIWETKINQKKGHIPIFNYCLYLCSLFVVIRTKDSINKQLHEAMGQASMFGHDNLQFKTVNHPLKHEYVELCQEFKLKQLSNELKLKLSYFYI